MGSWRRIALATACLAAMVAVVPNASAAPMADPAVPVELEAVCSSQAGKFAAQSSDAEHAAALLDGIVHVSTYAPQPLPEDVDWASPPATSSNYQVQFQALVWTDVLRREYLRTGEAAYLDRYAGILADFVADNSDYTQPLTSWTWYDHPAGQRASVLSCAMTVLGRPDWLVAGVTEHVRALTDPATYDGVGNHSLMQNTGLVTAGVALGDGEAIALGRLRAQEMLPGAVSADGVSLEGSVGYHGLNHIWWREMEAVIEAAGAAPMSGVERIGLMGRFGADATFPDGTAANIGDGFPGSGSRYDAADARAFSVYQPGYLFSRTSGPAGRTVLAARYGQSYLGMAHGHMDAGSLQLWAFGRLMVSDSGTYAYGGGFWRSWVKSAVAHNVMTAYGSTYRQSATGRLVRWVERDGYRTATFSLPVMNGVTWYRTVKQSLVYGWILVDDQVRSTGSRTWVQRWNLPDGVSYQVLRGRIDQTTGSGGRVSVLAVAGSPSLALRQGVKASSLERTVGWRSYGYELIEPAPTAELTRSGTSWHLVTLVAPRRSGEAPPTVQVSDVVATASGATVTVRTARGTTRTTIARLG